MPSTTAANSFPIGLNRMGTSVFCQYNPFGARPSRGLVNVGVGLMAIRQGQFVHGRDKESPLCPLCPALRKRTSLGAMACPLSAGADSCAAEKDDAPFR